MEAKHIYLAPYQSATSQLTGVDMCVFTEPKAENVCDL